MNEKIAALLKRQAEWQKQRSGLSWAEKIRESEKARAGIVALKKSKKV